MKDFTLAIYQKLLENLQQSGYTFHTFREYMLAGNFPESKTIMLRHDVDDRKQHSLEFARIQHGMGIKGTYYFRMVPQSYDEQVIRQIHELGHEVGYHYEDMDFARGDRSKAYELFKQHLEQLREIVPIDTICMHGSPKSAYDNKDVWKTYDYRKHGIIGEPYFDIDFNHTFYITDTGRMWDGFKVSVRDKVSTDTAWPQYHSTSDIIDALSNEEFPDHVMMNFHPQRWTDNSVLWLKESIVQSAKNRVKGLLIKFKTWT